MVDYDYETMRVVELCDVKAVFSRHFAFPIPSGLAIKVISGLRVSNIRWLGIQVAFTDKDINSQTKPILKQNWCNHGQIKGSTTNKQDQVFWLRDDP